LLARARGTREQASLAPDRDFFSKTFASRAKRTTLAGRRNRRRHGNPRCRRNVDERVTSAARGVSVRQHTEHLREAASIAPQQGSPGVAHTRSANPRRHGRDDLLGLRRDVDERKTAQPRFELFRRSVTGNDGQVFLPSRQGISCYGERLDLFEGAAFGHVEESNVPFVWKPNLDNINRRTGHADLHD
jgi:hypothetical protein